MSTCIYSHISIINKKICTIADGSREFDSYNAQFMNAFKCTPTYHKWLKTTSDADVQSFINLIPMHPFSGQLSVADMKLKFTQ